MTGSEATSRPGSADIVAAAARTKQAAFTGAPPATTYVFIAESIEFGIFGNQEVVKRKKSAIGAGTVMIVLGVLLTSTSLLYSLNR